MICKSLEGYVASTHGADAWTVVRRRAALPFERFEALLGYDDDLFRGVQAATSEVLDLPVLSVMEDVGTWVCTHPPLASVQRLFRFSGATFEELVLSLDEIDARARMAVPELDLPAFNVQPVSATEFDIQSSWSVEGACAMVAGALRAMADEYGTLAMLEMGEASGRQSHWTENLHVTLVEEDFHQGKEFHLGGQV